MKRIALASFLVLTCANVFAQKIDMPENQILGKKQYRVKEFVSNHAVVPIGNDGFLCVNETAVKPRTYSVIAGDSFTSADSLLLTPNQGSRKLGAFQSEESAYVFLNDKKNYVQIMADSDYTIKVSNFELPKGFTAKGVAKYKDQALLYSDNSILAASLENGENRLIEVLSKFEISGKISRIQSFDGLNEIVIQVSSPASKYMCITSLLRYDMENGDVHVMNIPKEENIIEGDCIINEENTIFSGTEFVKPRIVEASYFMVFEDDNRIISTRTPLNNLLEEDISSEPKHKQRAERSYANTYTPILLEDGNIFVFTDIYSERLMAATSYNTSRSVEENLQYLAFSNRYSIASIYDEEGYIVWSKKINQMPFRYVSDFEDANSVSLISPEVVLAVCPGYQRIHIERIDLSKERTSNYYYDMKPVNSQTEEFYEVTSPSRLPYKVTKIDEHTFLYYGLNETKPIDKKYPIRRNYELQILDIDEN